MPTDPDNTPIHFIQSGKGVRYQIPFQTYHVWICTIQLGQFLGHSLKDQDTVFQANPIKLMEILSPAYLFVWLPSEDQHTTQLGLPIAFWLPLLIELFQFAPRSHRLCVWFELGVHCIWAFMEHPPPSQISWASSGNSLCHALDIPLVVPYPKQKAGHKCFHEYSLPLPSHT